MSRLCKIKLNFILQAAWLHIDEASSILVRDEMREDLINAICL
jgi:hypothetical protein